MKLESERFRNGRLWRVAAVRERSASRRQSDDERTRSNDAPTVQVDPARSSSTSGSFRYGLVCFGLGRALRIPRVSCCFVGGARVPARALREHQ